MLCGLFECLTLPVTLLGMQAVEQCCSMYFRLELFYLAVIVPPWYYLHLNKQCTIPVHAFLCTHSSRSEGDFFLVPGNNHTCRLSPLLSCITE